MYLLYAGSYSVVSSGIVKVSPSLHGWTIPLDTTLYDQAYCKYIQTYILLHLPKILSKSTNPTIIICITLNIFTIYLHNKSNYITIPVQSICLYIFLYTIILYITVCCTPANYATKALLKMGKERPKHVEFL